MSKIKCKLNITNNKTPMISFLKYRNNILYWCDIVSYFIINDSKPMLKLYCHSFDDRSKFYEYTINYIIDNEIGKYSYIEFVKNYQHYTVIAYFDIIDMNILLQLI